MWFGNHRSKSVKIGTVGYDRQTVLWPTSAVFREWSSYDYHLVMHGVSHLYFWKMDILFYRFSVKCLDPHQALGNNQRKTENADNVPVMHGLYIH